MFTGSSKCSSSLFKIHLEGDEASIRHLSHSLPKSCPHTEWQPQVKKEELKKYMRSWMTNIENTPWFKLYWQLYNDSWFQTCKYGYGKLNRVKMFNLKIKIIRVFCSLTWEYFLNTLNDRFKCFVLLKTS